MTAFKTAMSFFDKKEYINAILKFGENIKEFKNGNNFYKNLLYLGISFKEINKQEEACTAFNKIISASDVNDNTIKIKAETEIKTINCKK